MSDYSILGLPRTKASISSPVSFQSLSRLAMTVFMNGCESCIARSLLPRRSNRMLRAVALVGPLEAEPGEALDLVVLVQALAIDGDDETVDGTPALVHGHGSHQHGCTGKAFHIIHELVACALSRIGVAFGDSARLVGMQPRTKRQVGRLAVVHIPKPPR